jgi:site-specific DNA recombinase
MLDLDSKAIPADAAHAIVLPVRLQRAGMEMRLIDERGAASDPDPSLQRLLAKAWSIRTEVLKGDGRSLDAIARDHGIGDSYLGRLLRLGFLAPDIVETILHGNQPPHLSANTLANLPAVPADWTEQRRIILGRPAD